MKKLLLYSIAFLFAQHLFAQGSSYPVYYTPVTMPSSLKNNYYGLFDTKLLAEDLAGLLKQATGESFEALEYKDGANKGIFLLLDSNKNSLKNEEGEVESDGKNFIRITARFTTGISYALYSWLEQLGFHFYLPGDEWNIIPSLNSVFNRKTKQTFSPYFHIRMFYASGGIFPVKGVDENGQNEKDWRLWYRRNRMGCDYIRIDGHIGETFNIAHQKEIENDTSIVAPIKGIRKYTVGSKLDPTYKKGVALFSDWIVDQFKKEQASLPHFLPFKKYYTVDAGDGLDYCHTPECEKEFRSVSDQVFSIANECAGKIKLADPRAGVSSLAYGERTDTPYIKLDRNVHIMVVPNAFQSVTTSAELLQRWAKKTSNFSVYDYLNIGVWVYDKPFFNMYRYYDNMQFLKSLKAEGMSFETSLSKFASGVQQYFILKFLCDPYASMDDALDEFCKNNFGNASVPIKKLLKEWYFSDVHLKTNYNNPSFYEDELGRFVKYIIDAENTPGLSSAIQKRIDELKAYTIYLCKFYELFAELKSQQDYASDPLLRNKKTEDLLTYTWQLYHTKIFHNTQLNDMLKRPLPEQEKEKWNYYKSDHLKNITESTSDIVKNKFPEIVQKYLPLAAANYPVTDSFLTTNIKYSADSIKITTTDEKEIVNFIYPLQFYCAGPCIVKIFYQAGSSFAKKKKDKIAIIGVESADYRFIKNDFIYKENSSGSMIYSIPARGHYNLYLSQYNSTPVSYIIYPGKSLFYHNQKSILVNGLLMQDNSGKLYPNKYLAIYAPQADSLYFSNLYTASVNTSNWYTSAGKPIIVNPGSQPFYNSAAIPKDPHTGFIFYENRQFRWPPVLKNTAPYYFFLKYPLH